MNTIRMSMKRLLGLVTTVSICGLLILSACTAAAPPTPTPSPAPTPASLALSSAAFTNGQKIPDKYTCQGANVSPPLSWSGVPQGAQSFALITEDMDGPSGIITHWIIFNIPASARELAEAIPQGDFSDGTLQGNNVRGQAGFTGPCPPPGTLHRYQFTLFALDQMLSLKSGATRAEFLAAIQGHIVGLASLMGIYQR